jgi:hypothetical protein
MRLPFDAQRSFMRCAATDMIVHHTHFDEAPQYDASIFRQPALSCTDKTEGEVMPANQ